MDSTIVSYLIKVSIALALFYGLYVLLLRNDTFFRLRRFYFLFAMFFSLLFPLLVLKIPVKEETPVQMPVYWLSQINMVTEVTVASPAVDSWFILLIILGAVTLIYAIRFLIQLSSVIRLRIVNESQKLKTFRIIKLKDKKTSPFSFFGWIFISTQNVTDDKYKEIIAHELVHVRQYHSVDTLFAEIFCIFFWWNPFAWLLKKEIKINLEYLADEGVLKAGFDSREYQYIMLQASSVNTGIPIINNFNVSQLKRRITMMNKNRTSVGKATKYLLLIPVAFALLLGNAVQASSDILSIPFADSDQVPQKKGDVYVTVEQMPEFEGGFQAQQRFIAQNLKYPAEAQKAGVQGRVVIRYIVKSTGEVSDVEVIRSVDSRLDKEAVRVVEAMPKWTPGKQNGKAVDVYYTLPVIFKLAGSNVDVPADDNVVVAVGNANGNQGEGFVMSNVSVKELKEGDPSDIRPFITVDQMPVFPGGISAMQKYIIDNLKYPESAHKAGIQGHVAIRYIVGKTGEISDVTVIKGIDPACDAEAVRVVKAMPKWTPGKQNGKVVPVYYTLPIVFSLKK